MAKLAQVLSLTVFMMQGLTMARADFYDVLGIDRHESQQGVKQAFRRLSLQWHPDKHQSEEDKDRAQAMFIHISKAYDTLGDEDKRRDYDEWGDEDDASRSERRRRSEDADTANSFRPRTFYQQPSWNAEGAYTAPGHGYYAHKKYRAKQAYANPSQGHYAREASYAKYAHQSPGQRGSGGFGMDPFQSTAYFQAPRAPYVSSRDGAANVYGVNAEHIHCARPSSSEYHSQRGSSGSNYGKNRFGWDSQAPPIFPKDTFPKEAVLFPKS